MSFSCHSVFFPVKKHPFSQSLRDLQHLQDLQEEMLRVAATARCEYFASADRSLEGILGYPGSPRVGVNCNMDFGQRINGHDEKEPKQIGGTDSIYKAVPCRTYHINKAYIFQA